MKKEEILDVVNEKGEKIGVASREECHSNKNLIHKAVHCLVFNEKGEIYLQKRSKNKKIQPGKWDTSVGGHVDAGEAYEEALKREAKEELGIELNNFEYLYRYIWKCPVETEYIKTFRAKVNSNMKIKPNFEEIEEGRFWNKQDLTEKIKNEPEIFTPNFLYEVKLMAEHNIF